MRKIFIVLTIASLCMTIACQTVVDVASSTATPAAPTPVATVIPTPTPVVMAPTPYPITISALNSQVETLKHAYSVDYTSMSMERAVVSADLILEAHLEGVYAVPSASPLKHILRFSTITCMKGHYDKESIDIVVGLNTPPHFTIGDHYIIMVRGYDSVYEPAIQYFMDMDNIINIKDDKLYNLAKVDEQVCLFESMASFSDLIKESLSDPDIKPSRPSLSKVTHTLSLDPYEIINYSDAVVEVRVKRHDHTIPTVHCEVTATHKGTLVVGDCFQVGLFPSVVQSQSYLLLLKDDGSAYTLASRYGCVNLDETERYQQYMDCMEAAGLLEDAE